RRGVDAARVPHCVSCRRQPVARHARAPARRGRRNGVPRRARLVGAHLRRYRVGAIGDFLDDGKRRWRVLARSGYSRRVFRTGTHRIVRAGAIAQLSFDRRSDGCASRRFRRGNEDRRVRHGDVAHGGGGRRQRHHRIRRSYRPARDTLAVGKRSSRTASVRRIGRRGVSCRGRHPCPLCRRCERAANWRRHGANRRAVLRLAPAPASDAMIMRSDAPSWSLRDVNHRPPGAPRDTVSEASLEIDQGALTALIGPNGAGKTTLLRMLLGTIAPSSGTILFRGRAIREWSRRDLARSIGVVPQSEGEPLFGVRELVAMGRYPHLGPWQRERDEDVRAVDRAMTRCDVAQFADRWTTTLSGGEQQRVRLARALAQKPAILVLDEPTASLDIRHEMTTFELLRRLRIDGTTVLVATHNLNLA